MIGGKLDTIPAPPASIVGRDTNDIAACDLMLVYWPEATKKRGIGTLMEIAIAFRWHKPIILVDPSGQIVDHPWIAHCVTETFPDLSLAWDSIIDYWGKSE